MKAEDIPLGAALTRAASTEALLIGDITADAFRRDPFNLWLFRNFAGIEALFRAQAKRIYVPRGFTYRLGEDGACMWMLPGGDTRFTFADYAAIGWATLMRCGPGAVGRALKTGAALDQRHPRFAHAYLFSIGVRQSAQGKGLGRKLIQPVLDACDRAGVPAYLENSNPQNTGFYTSCGFEPHGEPIVPQADSPPLVPMLRRPRRA